MIDVSWSAWALRMGIGALTLVLVVLVVGAGLWVGFSHNRWAERIRLVLEVSVYFLSGFASVLFFAAVVGGMCLFIGNVVIDAWGMIH